MLRRIPETVRLLWKLASNRRFRRDVKALKYSSDGYVHYGVNLLQDMEIWQLLESSTSLDELSQEANVDHARMLEHILDYLVQRDVLEYNDGKYHQSRFEDPFTSEKRKYLEENYPYSVRWNDYLLQRAPETLRSGVSPMDAGFDSEFVEIWDRMMDEAPYSFKKIAIQKLLSAHHGGGSVIEYGCGSGSLLQILLEEADESIRVRGIDRSENSLVKARERLAALREKGEGSLLESNVDSVELWTHDLRTANPIDGEYDFGMSSLVFNHIPSDERDSVIKNIYDSLSPGGTFAMYQLMHKSKFDRVPIWLMHTVPTHREYPYRDDFVEKFRAHFDSVDTYYMDTILIAEKNA